MNFGKHVKRKALYCCSVSVVGLLIACLIGFAMGVGLVDVHLEEEAHAAASSGTSSETSSTSGALKKNSASQSQTQAVSSPTQVALDGISAVEGSATITTQGFTLSADSQAAVQSQIATFEADGYTASFVLADITTGRTIAYNADAQIYSASSAKAPYLISLFSTGTVDLNSVVQSADAQSATVHQKVDAVLRNSDNASYDWLYKRMASTASTRGPNRQARLPEWVIAAGTCSPPRATWPNCGPPDTVSCSPGKRRGCRTSRPNRCNGCPET